MGYTIVTFSACHQENVILNTILGLAASSKNMTGIEMVVALQISNIA